MITTTRSTRRATKTTANNETKGRGVPARALADGVLERRRAPRRRNEPAVSSPTTPTEPARGELLPELLSPTEHYRLEIQRRSGRSGGGSSSSFGDLATLLAEAKAEYEAMLAAPRPAGKGGRPKKKPAPKPDEIELSDEDALGDE